MLANTILLAVNIIPKRLLVSYNPQKSQCQPPYSEADIA